MAVLRRHAIPRALLIRFCDPEDDLADLDLLRRGQVSKSALLLRIVRDLTEGAVPEPHRSALRARIEALTALQRRHPDAVAAVLTGPHFGAWATHCLRVLTGPGPVDGGALTDLEHLGGFVAAAAIRAGAEIAVSVPVRAGVVVIPAIGRAEVPAEATSAWVQCAHGLISVDATRSAVVAPLRRTDRCAPGWRPLDVLQAVPASGRRWSVIVDPDDPYLGFFDNDPPGHPADVTLGAHFRAACDVLDGLYAHKTSAIARLISCLVPVAAGAGVGLSATSAAAAGAVALTEPSSALGLAVTLVHEHQHQKLNALHDVLPLVADTEARYYSPWRNEPRPASGLLHGAYAFLGVGDFWLRTCRRQGAHRGWHLELARVVRQVALACDGLRGSPDLTEAGAELLGEIASRTHRWATRDLPPDVARVANDLVVEHEVRWRLRHHAPSAVEVARLATGPAAAGLDPGDGDEPAGYGTESDLVRAAKRWAAGERPADPVDRLILDGRYGEAQSMLIGGLQTMVTPRDWTALVLVARHTDLAQRCPPLRTRPELAYALYRELRRRQTSVSFADLARHVAIGGAGQG